MKHDLEQSFITAVRENLGIIIKICRMYQSGEENCRDLQQEILIQLWKGFSNFRGDSKISTWIYRVALNTAISDYRKSKRMPLKKTIGADELKIPEQANEFDEADHRRLYKAIDGLNEVERAITLLYLEDFNYKGIAEMVGITANNARVRLCRIKDKLRKILEDYEG